MCSAVGCFDGIGVTLEPEVPSTYDVDFVTDGVAGAFTCSMSNGGWQVTNPTGSVPVERCVSDSFSIRATPESAEITMSAQDGSWRGSVNASLSYETVQPNGPDCPPACEVGSLTVLQQSICGSERLCVPEGTWVVTYDTGSSNLVADPNTIGIDANGAPFCVEDTDYETLPAAATRMTQ